MAEEQKKDDFEFEIEGEEKEVAATQQETKEAKGKPQDPQLDLEIEDDTPEQDRGREPMPKHLVDELEADELESYSENVKARLKQMKKVWHDERREKERVLRENQEALALTQRMMEENRRLKATLSNGEKTYMDTVKNAAELELDNAKRIYKEAFDSGDSDQIVAAQEKLSEANHKMFRLKEYRPSLQEEEVQVQNEPVQQVPRLDAKTAAWQERNRWWGVDEEMTALALGFHQKLEKQYGRQYVGTDEYWQKVDDTMRRRFPEYFGENEQTTSGAGKPATRTETKPANVVAPASRSTSSKKIVLKQSQIVLAKKLGLTPEQYAKEYAKTMGN
jgi:hypothetical protein